MVGDCCINVPRRGILLVGTEVDDSEGPFKNVLAVVELYKNISLLAATLTYVVEVALTGERDLLANATQPDKRVAVAVGVLDRVLVKVRAKVRTTVDEADGLVQWRLPLKD